MNGRLKECGTQKAGLVLGLGTASVLAHIGDING